MKLQILLVSSTCILVVLASSLVTVPSVKGQQNSSESTTLTGSLPLLGPYSFDLCSTILFGLVSCSVSFSVAEVYNQSVTLQIQDPMTELQIGNSESTSVTLSTDLPVQSLVLNFTYGTSVHTFSVPLPSFPVPGSIPLQISISSYLANFLTGPIIGTIFSHIASLDLDLNFSSVIQGAVYSPGFVSVQKALTWDTPSTVTYGSKLTGSAADSFSAITQLNATFGLGAALVLKLPLISPINLFTPFNQPLLQMGSSTTLMPLGHWYHLTVQSPYSKTSGSGWYLSGTQTTFSVADMTVPGNGGNYEFTGWTGTRTGGYSGPQESGSIVVTSPLNETANWNFVQNASRLDLGPMGMVLGISLLAGLIIVAIVAIIVLRRPKKVQYGSPQPQFVFVP